MVTTGPHLQEYFIVQGLLFHLLLILDESKEYFIVQGLLFHLLLVLPPAPHP
jgi:hypothetical protein